MKIVTSMSPERLREWLAEQDAAIQRGVERREREDKWLAAHPTPPPSGYCQHQQTWGHCGNRAKTPDGYCLHHDPEREQRLALKRVERVLAQARYLGIIAP